MCIPSHGSLGSSLFLGTENEKKKVSLEYCHQHQELHPHHQPYEVFIFVVFLRYNFTVLHFILLPRGGLGGESGDGPCICLSASLADKYMLIYLSY